MVPANSSVTSIHLIIFRLLNQEDQDVSEEPLGTSSVRYSMGSLEFRAPANQYLHKFNL